MSLKPWFDEFFARVWNVDDTASITAAIHELVSQDCKVFGLPDGRDLAREGFLQFRNAFRSSFERAQITVDDFLEVGERVAFRATFRLWKGGKEYAITGGGMAVVRNGQIVEAWNQWDFLSLLGQLEAVPADRFATALKEQTFR